MNLSTLNKATRVAAIAAAASLTACASITPDAGFNSVQTIAPDDLKGEEIVAFVTLENNAIASDDLKNELKKHVVQEIGAIARPGEIKFADALPKTRSGKIMRRLLRSLAAGEEISGDTSTLEDRSVLEKLREG